LAVHWTGSQTAPGTWTYTLQIDPEDNFNISQATTTITMTGLTGVTAAGPPTSSDFPNPIGTAILAWTPQVLNGGTTVVWSITGGGTGNFSTVQHVFGFTITAPGAPNGTVSFATNGFQVDDNGPRLDISGTVAGPTSASPCDVNQDGKTNVVDAQGMINEALGVASPANDLNGDGVVNGVDLQIVLNAALNLGCSASTDKPATAPRITAMVNAASFQSGPIAPGEVVALIRSGFGSSGGVQVLFDGTPAPLTYVTPTQIHCIVPYEVSGKGQPEILIRDRDRASVAFKVTAVASNPAIFTADGSGIGQAAALNEDQSANSPSNPAARGSTLVLFVTGEGQTSPSGVTGKLTATAGRTPQPLLPVAVLIGGQPASVTSYGEAPGVISGVMQLSVRIPLNAPPGEIPASISVGGNNSQSGVTVSVRE
jgi:uncharacterized protein (TIGR03437 family)